MRSSSPSTSSSACPATMTLSRKLQGAGVQLDCSPARSPASTTRTAAGLVLLDGVSLLRPDEQVFTAMLDGRRAQQLARNLAFGTIDKRLNSVRAFARHADAHPWSWRSQMIDEWPADLPGRRRSAVRNRKDATMTVKPRASAPSWSLRAGVSPCSVAWLSLFGCRCSGSGARAGRRRAEKVSGGPGQLVEQCCVPREMPGLAAGGAYGAACGVECLPCLGGCVSHLGNRLRASAAGALRVACGFGVPARSTDAVRADRAFADFLRDETIATPL